MICVKYRGASGQFVMDEEFDDVEEAKDVAATLQAQGFADVAVMIDVETADQTARAMAFTPAPMRVIGAAGYSNWRS